MLLGHPAITGFCRSCTITLKTQFTELLELSVAKYFTCVVPTGKKAPLARPSVRSTRNRQLSLKVGSV